jgi:hypothetical protein
MFLNLTHDMVEARETLNFSRGTGLDIIEKGIIEALFHRFFHHWDSGYREWVGPNYIGFQGSKPTIEDLTKIPINDLKTIFKHNKLINTIKYEYFALPPNSKIRTNYSDGSRNIEIENDFCTLLIDIFSSGGGVAQLGIWGVLESDPSNINRFWTSSYEISLTLKIDRLKRYSPDREVYLKWFNNIRESLKKFDGATVDSNIEKQSLRNAISKIASNEKK